MQAGGRLERGRRRQTENINLSGERQKKKNGISEVCGGVTVHGPLGAIRTKLPKAWVSLTQISEEHASCGHCSRIFC